MIDEVFRVALGSWLLGTLVTPVLGAAVGFSTRSTGWRVLWFLALGIVVFVLVTTSNYLGVLNLAGQPSLVGEMWVSLSGLYLLLLLAGLLLGAAIKRGADEQLKSDVAAIPENDLLEIVERALIVPQVAVIPWVTSVWSKLSTSDRHAWIARHAAPIRVFVLQHGGIDSVPIDAFVVELQRLDRTTTGTTLAEPTPVQ